MDDRKQRIMTAIVSLYSGDGEPIGSNLLCRHFDMAVSSATLRNEMAALTRLGLLEQPHTSAGRVPTTKGYRYYVDNLLGERFTLSEKEKAQVDEIFAGLDYDPEKLVQGAARGLSGLLGCAVVATTPRAEDQFIAHYEVIQVGRYTAAVLGVTGAGGVRTRVAKVDGELAEGDTEKLAGALNGHFRFVAEADIDAGRIRAAVDSLGALGAKSWPVFSAALTLLSEVGRGGVFFEGQQNLLQWPELEPNLRTLITFLSDDEHILEVVRPRGEQTTILFGDEFPEDPIPGLSLVIRNYLVGGGLSGAIAVVGPSRMKYSEVLPRLEYFCNLLGQGMSGNMAV